MAEYTWGRAYVNADDWLLKECRVCGKKRYWWRTKGAYQRDVMGREWEVRE